MAAPGIPQSFFVQTANSQVLTSWGLVAGATSYKVQRSLDNITYTTIATISGTPLATSYLDTSVTVGQQYWYQVCASNGTDSAYTTPQSAVPAKPGEISLGAIRLAAQQRADRVNSNFVTLPEWNSYINMSMYALYDKLITVYEDYFIGTPIQFVANGSTYLYPLPDGLTTFTNGITGNTTFTAPAFYKLKGVDLALQTAANAFVTVNNFNFSDRNNYVYPNTASSIYGVFNCQYKILGNNLQFIPTPSGNQTFRVWYIPRLTELLADTDITSVSISGWIEYVIIKAAIYALTKEEQDTSALVMQLADIEKRIEDSAANRDAGMPDKISAVRRGPYGNGWGSGNGGFPMGGF